MHATMNLTHSLMDGWIVWSHRLDIPNFTLISFRLYPHQNMSRLRVPIHIIGFLESQIGCTIHKRTSLPYLIRWHVHKGNMASILVMQRH